MDDRGNREVQGYARLTLEEDAAPEVRRTGKEANMIRKAGGKYVVLAESGRRMGTYDTKAEAQKRLRQIEFFKHAKKTGAGSRMRSS